MEGLVQIVGLLLICLMFVSIALSQRRSSEGFTNDSVPASLKDANNMVISKEPDLCSSLPAVDCNKTLGCEWSADVGLCVKRHLVREAAAHGDAMRSAIDHFENYMPDAGPQPANVTMF